MKKHTIVRWVCALGLIWIGYTARAQEAAGAVPADPAPPAAVAAEEAQAPAPVEAPKAVENAPAVEAPKPVEDAAAPAPAGGMLEVSAEEKTVQGAEVSEASPDNKISITLDNVPLQDVVRMFTRISGANIVSGTNLQGSVTVNLQEVEWEPALRVILDTTGNTLVEKTPGIFTIISKSELGSEPMVSDTIFLSYATVTNILPVVKSMIISTNGMATGFPGANAIIIQETAGRMKSIKEVVERIDKARDQVLIETKFVELNDEAIKDIGLNWEVLQGYTMNITPGFKYDKNRVDVDKSGNASLDTAIQRDLQQDAVVNTRNGSAFNQRAKSSPPSTDTRSSGSENGNSSLSVAGRNFTEFNATENKLTLVPRLDRTITDTISDSSETLETTTKALSAILSAEQFSLTMSALKQNAGVEVLSNPKVVVASGETATIHVGKNEPNVVAVPQGDTGDRYAYQLDGAMPFIEIGVKLRVTPTLNTESNITVKITPELSRKLADKSVGEAGTTYPVTQIRKIDTEFNLESGRTVAIGGLTESTDKEVVKKVPVLGDIPIIGKYLFRHTHTEKVQDEVIIFVTVTSARPSTLAQISGIPEEGRLIHRHMARSAEEKARADQEKSRTDKKPKSVKSTKFSGEN